MFDTTTLLLTLLFSCAGLGYFVYGKRQDNLLVKYTGIALMVYPYFVSNNWAILAVGIALLALPKFL